MVATRLTCALPSCTLGLGAETGGQYKTYAHWQTHNESLQDMAQHIEVHKLANREGSSSDAKPDKFPRPQIAESATDTEWEFFAAAWLAYKRATGLTDQTATDHLWHCATDNLKKQVFNSGVGPSNSSWVDGACGRRGFPLPLGERHWG